MKLGILGTLSLAAMLISQVALAETVKIGFVTTLTGGAGAIGNDMRDAVELALDHLGRKMGGSDVKMFYEDDTFKPAVGKQKTEKLVKKDKVHFVTGYIWSHVLLASRNSVVGKGPFMITSNAGPGPVAGKLCHEDFFSTSWQNDQTTMAMGEVLNQLGIKNLYIMAPNYAAGKSMVKGVSRTFKGKIIGKDMTKFPAQLDFSAELAKIRAAKPDAVFVFYPGKHGMQFFKQYSQAGLKGEIPLYSAFTVDSLSLPRLKDLAYGSLMTQFWAPDLDNAVNKRFVADYRKKTGRYPTFYAAQSYDTIMLINSAVTAVGGDLSNKDGMRNAMRKANFPSIRGPFKYGNNHFPIQNFYLRKVVKDADGNFTTSIVKTVYTNHQDPYAKDCKMSW
ncbi:MAG TPA: ABC transporter substrate-binding protein [Candidatus Lambdaproteobacteria bacterium]|nr:ABC transporter substrate-binding protein [Deltaproteobacteria bacterium]HHZ78707.1 ABC transporter substrate-binding protein [Candidatus Lambdaproteobacteria bacterium]HIA55860.1 ABC transporter substrate-binding protein [Candidatus Lambdaproteobacteria bacterium]HIB45298.1 ABC transporter substrate-binding protein [Candidatus Lambdaproteobacteria bacterium]HIB93224.1 ABC transporter substrate-binding protein [Candidatus Lambdaproteobacteria bacterium]